MCDCEAAQRHCQAASLKRSEARAVGCSAWLIQWPDLLLEGWLVAHSCACHKAGCRVLLRCSRPSPAAFTCYQTALQLRPNFPQGLNNLAVIFTAQGRAQDALQMLQAAIAAAPDYAEAYNNLGVLQREVGAIKASL